MAAASASARSVRRLPLTAARRLRENRRRRDDMPSGLRGFGDGDVIAVMAVSS
jgi:hypothetical protein